jgi:hypothetical protein
MLIFYKALFRSVCILIALPTEIMESQFNCKSVQDGDLVARENVMLGLLIIDQL